MAFSQGKVSSEVSAGGSNFKKYVGVAPVKVLSVNPTKEEWEKITGNTLQNDPEYNSVDSDGNQQARITLLVKPTLAEYEDVIIPINFWFKKVPVMGSESHKYQVIDKYGRTAWVTKEELEAKKIPQYESGPANIDSDYRRLVTGEEAFTNFLKAYLNIPSYSYRNKKGETVIHANPSECEARLDNIMKIFSGDFKEIKQIIGYQPENIVKILFGVRTTNEGREYQDFYSEVFLTAGNWMEGRFATELKKATDRGRYSNVYFGETNPNGEIITLPLREYTVTPTTFTESAATVPPVTSEESSFNDMPF